MAERAPRGGGETPRAPVSTPLPGPTPAPIPASVPVPTPLAEPAPHGPWAEPPVPGGMFGSVLVVDVTGGGARRLPLPQQVLREHLGGVGLGAWLLHELVDRRLDALEPAAPLCFVFSPLVGTPLTTSAKFAVVGISPLTGLLTDSLASSHFALAGKATGCDAIVLVGRSEEPCVVLVDEAGARVEPAADLWGLPAAGAERALRARLGEAWQVAATGPAGERGVRFATLSHDGRHAGRGGLGAVLGAKNVKALVVRGSRRTMPADLDGVLAAAADLRTRSRGRATRKYRELGTMANVLAFHALSTLPTRNFASARFDGAPQLAAEELRAAREVTKGSCAACAIGCEHMYSRRKTGGRHSGSGGDGEAARTPGVRMEYQSASSLGAMCGVSDADAVLEASARCDELGLDTISAGGTIAWAMECVERGVLDAPWLRFGDGAAVLRALEEIAAGTALGELLALGSRAAAAALGAGSQAWACHVKGLEMPGYDPRTLQTMALGLAVSARGADHNRSGAYDADLSGEVDRLAGGPAHVQAAVETEDRAAALDSLILCRFLAGVFDEPWPQWAGLLSLVTGWDMTADELRATAARIVLLKRAVNVRQGWQPGDDWLPPRLLSEPVVLPSGREVGLAPATLRAMVDGYWAARGLGPDGLPHA